MYGSDWQFIRSFTDSNLPAGYAPFNVRAIEDRLFVTFAMQDDSKSDEVAGPGLGYVDMFDMQGNLLRSFASQGTLNAPWGVALASKKFGLLSNALLVGNFGDGRISAYDFTMGTYLGQMIDATTGVAIQIEGLWDLRVKTDRLYFTAGINSEADGLVGLIKQ